MTEGGVWHAWVGATWISLLCVLAASAIPLEHLVVSPMDAYARHAGEVLSGMAQRIAQHPLEVLAFWILPAAAAFAMPCMMRAPLRRLFRIAAFGFAFSCWMAPLVVPEESSRLREFAASDPAAGYMAHDVLLLLVVGYVSHPHRLWVMGGPWTVTAHFGCTSLSAAPAAAYALLAAVSAAVVLPTQHRYVDEQGTLFLEGYSSSSVVATSVSLGMVMVWVIVFERVGQLARDTYAASPVSSVLFLLLGTALVELYVGAAFAACAAYARATRSLRA